MSYTITIPDVPPSLNRVLRMHWANKRRLSEDWQNWIILGMPKGGWALQSQALEGTKMTATITLHNARQFDKDNAYGACKIVFDALKKLHLIWDDRAEFLESSVEQVKSTRKDKKTVIEIGAADSGNRG